MIRLLKKRSVIQTRGLRLNRDRHWQSSLVNTAQRSSVEEQVTVGSVTGIYSRWDTPVLQVLEPCHVSVILPIYNEEACIRRTIAAVWEYAEKHPRYKFIFVNDGSIDATQRILETTIRALQTRQIQFIHYQTRQGKGYAIKTGVEFANGDYICFMDGDLAYSLDHLDHLLDQLAFFDVVIGCRNLVDGGDKGLRLTRKVAGKVFNTLSQWILNLRFSDMQAGIKGFKSSVAKELFACQKLSGFSFDVELIYLAKKWGYAIGEIPAHVSSSHPQKVSKVNLIQDSLKMLRDLFKVRLNDMIGRYE
jgi:hypothetical protein